jgi:transcriptional regulator with XRE-family HTH domain
MAALQESAKSTPFFTALIKKSATIQAENERQPSERDSLLGRKPESTDLNSIDRLIERISKGEKERTQFVASQVDKGIAYQIRALRDRQSLSQEALAKMVDMNQNAISRLESPHRGRPTITTLKRLAEAFDVALVVRFEPFSKLLHWTSGVPFIEQGMSTAALAPPSFSEEVESGAYQGATNTASVSTSYIFATSIDVNIILPDKPKQNEKVLAQSNNQMAYAA